MPGHVGDPAQPVADRVRVDEQGSRGALDRSAPLQVRGQRLQQVTARADAAGRSTSSTSRRRADRVAVQRPLGQQLVGRDRPGRAPARRRRRAGRRPPRPPSSPRRRCRSRTTGPTTTGPGANCALQVRGPRLSGVDVPESAERDHQPVAVDAADRVEAASYGRPAGRRRRSRPGRRRGRVPRARPPGRAGAQPSADARDRTGSSTSPRSRASTTSASSRASQAPRASAACA